MTATLKRLTPGILLAVSAAVLAGLAIAVSRASELDIDFDSTGTTPGLVGRRQAFGQFPVGDGARAVALSALRRHDGDKA